MVKPHSYGKWLIGLPEKIEQMKSCKAVWVFFLLGLMIACNIEQPENQTIYLPPPPSAEPEMVIHDGAFYMAGKHKEKDMRMKVVVEKGNVEATYYYVGLPEEYTIKGNISHLPDTPPLQVLRANRVVAKVTWVTKPNGEATLFMTPADSNEVDTIYIARTNNTNSY